MTTLYDILLRTACAMIQFVLARIPAPEAEYFELTFGPVLERPMPRKEVAAMDTMILKDSQQRTAAIAPKSKAGNPAQVDGAPAWESSDPAVVAVSPVADGLSAMVTAVGPVGVAVVTVSADADLGEGTRHISRSFNVSVEGGEANDLGFSFGEPQEKPESVPEPVE